MYFRSFTVLLVASLLAAGSAAALAIDASQYESLIKRGMDDWQVPGLATAVIEDGDVVYTGGFGRTSVADGAPVTPDTPFAIASLTKAMLVAGLLIEVDKGTIVLDDPIVDWIPELRFADHGLAERLTLRDLLAHRAGIPSTDFLRYVQGMNIEQELEHLPYIKPVAQPRTRLIYQNTMYELAGLVLERATGGFWGDILKETLWKPIGMTSTVAMRGDLPERPRQAEPHDVVSGELRVVHYSRPPDTPNAAGSVWSTTADMARWALFLLRGGVTAAGERLISNEAFAAWFEPAQLATPEDFYPVETLTRPRWRSYALGWFQQDFDGHRIDFHTGSVSGLVAIMGLDFDAGRAMVMLANRDHAELRHALLWHVMDESPSTQRRDWHAEVLALYEAKRKDDDDEWDSLEAGRIEGATPSLEPAAYTGTYVSDAWGELTVEMDSGNDRLVARNREYALTHWHGDIFLARYGESSRGEFVKFRLTPGGKVSALEFMEHAFERQ